MTSLQDFVSMLQSQEHFDPEAGAILPITYAQNFVVPREVDDLLLATKYAYFRAFLQKCHLADDRGRCILPDRSAFLWAKSRDMRFAIDGTCFMPAAGDRITLLKTCLGYMDDHEAEVVGFKTFKDGSDKESALVRIEVDMWSKPVEN
jgi:hypothetical protein